MKGAMTPMAQSTQVLMTSLGKGMTYSLDRRQVKRVPRQNSQQGFQIYNQLNNGNPQRKRYVSESVNPKTVTNLPIIEDPYSVRSGSLKKKMSLNFDNSRGRVRRRLEDSKFVFKMTPVSTPIHEESPLLSESSTLVEHVQNKSKLMDTDSESECQEIKEALNSVGETSPSSGEYVKSVA